MTKGFTLVELLAVIVILAVLALIATPVVLSIIDDTKESAMLRSAEMYLSGVENAVMRENMNSGGNFRPNDCTISNGTLSCNSTTVEVEVNGEVPKNGSIVFENGKIKEVELIYESGTIIKDDSGNLVYEGSKSEEGVKPEETITQVYKPQYYSFSTGSYAGDLPADATTNASELDTKGHLFYLGLDVDSNNKVTDPYVCFTRNNQEYCLKYRAYETNKTILEDAFKDVENACSISNDNIGDTISCNANGLNAKAYYHGLISVGDGSASCSFPDSSGRFQCYES